MEPIVFIGLSFAVRLVRSPFDVSAFAFTSSVADFPAKIDDLDGKFSGIDVVVETSK